MADRLSLPRYTLLSRSSSIFPLQTADKLSSNIVNGWIPGTEEKTDYTQFLASRLPGCVQIYGIGNERDTTNHYHCDIRNQ